MGYHDKDFGKTVIKELSSHLSISWTFISDKKNIAERHPVLFYAPYSDEYHQITLDRAKAQSLHTWLSDYLNDMDEKVPVVFVSGHLDLTREEFYEHYVPVLLPLVASHHFIVGDAEGCDALAQEFLSSFNATYVIYHMFKAPRNCYDRWVALFGGFKSDSERDEAMTRASSLDVAWIRPGRENSGTAKNLKRRCK